MKFVPLYKGIEKIKANLNRENIQEGSEFGFKNYFKNTINSSKRSTDIKR